MRGGGDGNGLPRRTTGVVATNDNTDHTRDGPFQTTGVAGGHRVALFFTTVAAVYLRARARGSTQQ